VVSEGDSTVVENKAASEMKAAAADKAVSPRGLLVRDPRYVKSHGSVAPRILS